MQLFDVVWDGGRDGTARTRCLWRATRAREESCGRHGYAAPLIYAIGDRKAENRPEPLRSRPCIQPATHIGIFSYAFADLSFVDRGALVIGGEDGATCHENICPSLQKITCIFAAHAAID